MKLPFREKGLGVLIYIQRLESGYLRAQGTGPCQWAQWPEGRLPKDEDFFPEASIGFRQELFKLLTRDELA